MDITDGIKNAEHCQLKADVLLLRGEGSTVGSGVQEAVVLGGRA
jgi:hypothetical protein